MAKRRTVQATTKVYFFRPGSHLPKERAQATGEELERLRKKHGQISAEIVEREARPPTSPLHYGLTWDDAAAAHKCRLDEARDLINSTCVVVMVGGKEHRSPAFISITLDTNTGTREKKYVEITEAMIDPASREALLAQAKRELESFRRKYQMLQELSDIFAALDRLVS